MRNIITASLILTSLYVSAQNSSSSPYSTYGIGIINERTTSLNRSLGGTGIGIQDNANLNTMNPASYLSISQPVTHVFEIGMYAENNRYTTNAMNVSKINGGLSNINYWFRFKPGWASVLGLSPYSSVSYDILTTKTVADNSKANYRYTGSGNISQLYWGNAFKIFNNFSAGVHLSYLFGSINRSESITGSGTEGLQLDDKIFTNKLSIDYGIQYRMPFKNHRSLIWGATFQNGLKLNGNSDLTLYNTDGDTLTSQAGTNTDYKMPRTVGSGISFRTKRSLIAADAVFRQWSKASYSTSDKTFQDTWRMSLGYSYLGNENAESYLGLISLKAGVYMQNHYMKIRGNSITNYGFSFGAGIPVLDGKSTINLTYNYDNFGTTSNNLIQQRTQKFMLDIVIRDLWGYKRRFD
ncbi:hypothetical protein [Pseudochryseolinea flava]|uniref:Long-chain fatty acid transport protein n=1 Tax=Pseudochryseolinea flava TaxID=2059302 RepID=A0A364Y1N2_9BACT|nr:hypothetical protein [Pseudochryseolinea flava]RAW00007.1 hypothetical protein DQQ10_15730 [Pseudochryseolinea flava]